MTGSLRKPAVAKMRRIIKDAVVFNRTRKSALVAMLMPGHGIPIQYACGAVLDHDMFRLESFSMGWGAVVGSLSDQDRPEAPCLKVRIPLGDIVWLAPEIKEVK